MTTSENAGGASGALCVALAAAGIAGGALTIGGSGNDADYGEFRDASDNSDDSDLGLLNCTCAPSYST